MKMTVFLWFFGVISLIAGPAYSQNTKISLEMNDASLASVLNQIEEISEFYFLYNTKLIDVEKKVNIAAKNEPIKNILTEILPYNVRFIVSDRQIVLALDELIPEAKVALQQKSVIGKITDASTGEPLPGVNILVKGTTIGVLTDINGKYSITVPDPNSLLVVSFIGYEQQEVSIAGRMIIDIKMDQRVEALDEVIVVGYGTSTRKSVTGAVDQVKSTLLETRAVSDMTQALQGTSPNLIIQTREYDPAAKSTNLNIRGVSSFNNNTPLIVIDGMITDQDALNNLNAMDVDNISILKDAGSSAIYGSRSASGVILVTTKSGKKNTVPKVRLTAATGLQVPYYSFHPVSAGDNARYRNLANTNAGLAPYFTDAEIADIEAQGDHWPVEELIRTALQQSYSVNVSGGSDRTTYMFSLGYYDQESNVVGNHDYGIERYTFRTNISTEIGRFKITGILGYARNNSLTTSESISGLLGDATTAPPYYMYNMKDAEGHYLLNNKWSSQNPLGRLEGQGTSKTRRNAVNMNLATDFKIIEGLKLRGMFGADVSDYSRDRRNHVLQYYYADGTLAPMRSQSNERARTDNSWDYFLNSQLLLDFNRSFGRHNFSAVTGLTNEAYTSESSYIEMRYVDPLLGTATSQTNTTGNILGNTYITSGPQLWNISSFLGRVTYNYNERYYGEASFRYDGSSKFAKKSRWGFFPAVSLGYRISEEPFMENYREKIGELKIRGNYGVLGNQAVGAYDRYTTYSINSTGYMFNNTVTQTANFSPGLEDLLTWERTHTFDIGVDAAFLKNSLFVTFDYFHKNTTDILLNPNVPAVFGASMPKENIGAMKNQGWEFSVKYHLESGDFIHDINFNIADSRHEVTEFPNDQQIGGTAEGKRLTKVGLPINSYYGWVLEGIFQSDEEIATAAKPSNANVQPGDLRFKDQNDDGVIDTKDWTVLGNAFPHYTFGLIYNVSWKSLDFNMFWQGVGKREHFIRGELMEPFHANYSHNIYEHQLDFWTPENTDAEYPRIVDNSSPSRSNNWAAMSSLMIRDMAYARLKNIAIGYTLPSGLSSKIGLQRCRVYVEGQDVLTLSATNFMDPEVNEYNNNMGYSSADSGRHYPSLRYFGFGIDVEF